FRNGTDHERLAEPGRVYGIGIRLQNTAITFLKGHRARLILTSSSHPYWAVNLNDGGPMYDKHIGRVANNTIHVGGTHDSRLILPVVDN
ncbi:MAG TPA: CocE/NonD family hydrolase C-terminal non-catalytic domain-containing protein, partial [Pirellulales bacterium]|nr:CocE/NonD family hydrolase C-terminal non-catalytic domain-containing protein [Pirellulales bacterium]